MEQDDELVLKVLERIVERAHAVEVDIDTDEPLPGQNINVTPSDETAAYDRSSTGVVCEHEWYCSPSFEYVNRAWPKSPRDDDEFEDASGNSASRITVGKEPSGA